MLEKINQHNENDKKYWIRAKAIEEIKDKGAEHPDSHKLITEYIELNSDKNPVDLYLDLSDIYLEAGELGEFNDIMQIIYEIAKEAKNESLAQEVKNRIITEQGRL